MSNKEKGDKYENFVERMYRAILYAQTSNLFKTIKLEKKKIIAGVKAPKNEFDLYWEYEVGGILYRTAIECRDYSSTIPVDHLRDFAYKLQDCGNIKGIFATTHGFQDGAAKVAEKENIELVIVRKPKDEDWDGYIKKLRLDFKFVLPARIIDFQPTIDGNWVKQDTSYKEEDIQSFEALNKEVFIEDNDNRQRYSIYDLQYTLSKNEDGLFTETKTFKDAFIYCNNFKLKILSYEVKYQTFNTIEKKLVVDLAGHVVGILDYINRKHKITVLKDGRIKEEKPGGV